MGAPKRKENTRNLQEQIIQYLPIVHQEAKKMIRRGVVHHEYDELVQIGTIGLIQAVYRFDEIKGQSFSKYARIRIQGSILDELRKRDWVPRSVRHRSKQIKKSTEHLKGTLKRFPTQEEVCSYLSIEKDRFESYRFHSEIAKVISIDAGEHPVRDQISSTDQSPQESILKKELLCALYECMQSLDPQEQEIINQYYFQSRKMKEISERFGVTESRICQILRQTKTKLAKKLNKFQ